MSPARLEKRVREAGLAQRRARRERGGQGRRGGFTLVEVLVVLAILVILFGLLFAPMMAGLDMARQGRAQSRLQDVARLAAEEIRRDLVNAIYVYPPVSFPLANGTCVTDYAQIVFVPAETDANGNLVTPPRPRLASTGEYLAVRYWVKPPDTSNGRHYEASNPFVLVRQEGIYRWDPAAGQYVFGSIDPTSGNFVPGRAETENALTPREDYDIPATSTICLDCQKLQVGYVASCPDCGGTNLVYLHDDVQFQPERIIGEALVAQEHNTRYQARHGNWFGRLNNGAIELTGPLPLGESELQPRIVVYRWDGSAYRNVVLDTWASVPADQHLRYNSATGTVALGAWRTVEVKVSNPGTPPGTGQFYNLDIEGDTYNSAGSGTQTAPVAPIYPNAPTAWGEPAMPIAYRINPERSDGAGTPAKVVPGSIRVSVVARAGMAIRRAQYTLVEEADQTALGPYEFSVFMPTSQLWAEVRFNRYKPPSPADFGAGLTEFSLYISYYYRRNFDNTGPEYRDDVVYADYSTGEIINIILTPKQYVDLQPYRDGLPNLVPPPDMPIGGVPVRTQARLINARR